MEKEPVASSADWPFLPYEKILESLAAWLGDDAAAYRACSKVPFIVSEKIHGANLCFVTDGRTIRCAKRKEYLTSDEDFFGHRALLNRLSGPILQTFSAVAKQEKDVWLLFIYGELFGGAYPHPDVPAVAGVSAVQTGCWYAPGIEFCAFDLGILRAGSTERSYLEQQDSARICTDSGILFTQTLFQGSYEDAVALPLGFETTIPARLGLPSLGPSNKAEGVVLKPLRAVTLPRRTTAIRPVIKRKIAEFSEDLRFHEAKKWPVRSGAAPVALTLAELRQEVSALVNENRLQSAISKIGPVAARDTVRRNHVLKFVKEDLETELAQRHPSALAALSADESRALAAYVDDEARALVDLYLPA